MLHVDTTLAWSVDLFSVIRCFPLIPNWNNINNFQSTVHKNSPPLEQIHIYEIHFWSRQMSTSVFFWLDRDVDVSIFQQVQPTKTKFIIVQVSGYLFNFSVPNEETAQCVASVHFGAFQGHHDASILLAVLCWPVLVTFPLKHTACTELHLNLSELQSNVCFDYAIDQSEPTLPFSTRFVIMTMTPVFCSHTILQKSSNVDLRGPWAAI